MTGPSADKVHMFLFLRYDELKLATHDKQTLPAVSATTLEGLSEQVISSLLLLVITNFYLECNLPLSSHISLLVGWLFGWLVGQLVERLVGLS